MAVLPRRALSIPYAPLSGAAVFLAVLVVGLTVLRPELPGAEAGWFTRPIAFIAVIPVAVAGYLAGVILRGSTGGLRVLVSVTGGVAAAGLGLLIAGLGEPGQAIPGDLAWPGSNVGRAGLWLMAGAIGPVVAAWSIDYRRSDPWYIIPIWLTLLAWLVPLGAAALLLREV